MKGKARKRGLYAKKVYCCTYCGKHGHTSRAHTTTGKARTGITRKQDLSVASLDTIPSAQASSGASSQFDVSQASSRASSRASSQSRTAGPSTSVVIDDSQPSSTGTSLAPGVSRTPPEPPRGRSATPAVSAAPATPTRGRSTTPAVASAVPRRLQSPAPRQQLPQLSPDPLQATPLSFRQRGTAQQSRSPSPLARKQLPPGLPKLTQGTRGRPRKGKRKRTNTSGEFRGATITNRDVENRRAFDGCRRSRWRKILALGPELPV